MSEDYDEYPGVVFALSSTVTEREITISAFEDDLVEARETFRVFLTFSDQAVSIDGPSFIDIVIINTNGKSIGSKA